jgi:hypothetical protein
MKDKFSSNYYQPSLTGLKLKKLSADQIQHIDDFIASIREYGEICLVILHGKLKYING